MIKKISSIIMVTIFAYTSVFGFALAPKKAEAVFGVGDIVIDPNNIWQGIKDQVLIPLVQSTADRLINKLVDDTISWSNNGFEGEPGFINNWDEFLQGTKHDLIAGAFNAATVAAQSTVYQTSKQKYSECATEAGNVWDINEKLAGDLGGKNEGKSREQFINDRCYSKSFSADTIALVKSCSTSKDTRIKFIKDQGKLQVYQDYEDNKINLGKDAEGNDLLGCKSILKKEIPQKQRTVDYNKCVNDDAPVMFIKTQMGSSVDSDFKKFTDEVCSAASKNDFGAAGSIAQANYEAYANGQVKSARDVARNVASYGAQELVGNKLYDLFGAKGETLTTLFKQNGATKEDFNKNIAVAGWQGYIALSDPHNHAAGLQSLVQSEISKQTANTVKSKIQDLQTDNKYLNKITCDGTRDKDGNCIGREVTLTPGLLVQDQLSNALKSEQTKAMSLGDTLTQSLIKGVGKLTNSFIQKGVSSISKKATETFFQNSDTNIFVQNAGIDYQSEYDVLGIKSDGELSKKASEQAGLDALDEESRIKSMIGGPEDITGGPNDPQIIINFQENLESAIDNNVLELKYYDSVKLIVNKVRESAITMDRCNPGPDYGWKERYEDKLKTNKDNNKQLNNAIGLAETEDMASDPRINIPGAGQMTQIFDRIAGGDIINTPEVDERKKDLRENTLTLTTIQTGINTEISKQRASLNIPTLIVFRADWNKFDLAKKVAAFQSALDKGYALFPDESTLTIEEYVQQNNEKVRDMVINMGWEIWRRETNATDALKRVKKDFRYQYYLIESQVSTETFVKKAELKESQTASIALDITSIAQDCLTFRAFVFNQPLPPKNLEKTSLGKFEKSILTINAVNTTLIAAGIETISKSATWFFTGSNNAITYIMAKKYPSMRDDATIKAWLNSEYSKQTDTDINTVSNFETQYFTSPTAIENSILGFTGQETSFDKPEECTSPKIYLVNSSSLTSETVDKDYIRDDININTTGGTTSSTSYTATPTGNACSGEPTGTVSSCTSSGQTFCNVSDGNAYSCTAQTTSSGGGSTNVNVSLEEDGTRTQTNSTSIYVDDKGNVYSVNTASRSGTPTINYKTDQKVTFVNGKLPSTAKLVIKGTCTAAGTIQLSDVSAYLSERYPPLDDNKNFWGKAWSAVSDAFTGGGSDAEIVPAASVRAILIQDRVFYGTRLAARVSGILFCRNANGAAECTKNWYTATDLHYRLIFSKI